MTAHYAIWDWQTSCRTFEPGRASLAFHYGTDDPTEVTCKRCLDMMAKSVEARLLYPEVVHFKKRTGNRTFCRESMLASARFTDIPQAVTCAACCSLAGIHTSMTVALYWVQCADCGRFPTPQEDGFLRHHGRVRCPQCL